MITLIIVDCQNDFINGNMTVKGAKEAVENIKTYIKNNWKNIDKVIFTVDWHPWNHSSFKGFGGQWPAHCIQYTPGACIDSKLLKCVHSFNLKYNVSPKGTIEELEEYGAFNDIDFRADEFGRRYYLDVIEVNADSEFVICGIAGDYCVKATIENLLKEGITPKIYTRGVASIDGGDTFDKFIENNKLEKVV